MKTVSPSAFNTFVAKHPSLVAHHHASGNIQPGVSYIHPTNPNRVVASLTFRQNGLPVYRAGRVEKPTGYVVWQGNSPATGTPIVAIVTLKSRNGKTGNIPQLWILDANTAPHVLMRNGQDESICGSCPHRGGRGCYVAVHNAPLSVYNAFKRGKYPSLPDGFYDPRIVRLGAYGDPAMVPFEVVDAFVARFGGHLGYTHQWRQPWYDSRYADLVMASADTISEAFTAQVSGHRTFRVLPVDGDIKQRHPTEAHCPADSAGLTCEQCKSCNGSKGTQKGSVVIVAHGGKANKLSVS